MQLVELATDVAILEIANEFFVVPLADAEEIDYIVIEVVEHFDI
jgi:hypothetical protein